MPSATLNDLLDPSSAAFKKAKRLHLKTTKNRPEHVDADWTPFRAAEKKFKSRFPPPDLSQVFDIATGDESRAHEVARGGWHGRPDAVPFKRLKRQDDTSRSFYTFPDIPGLQYLHTFAILTLTTSFLAQVWYCYLPFWHQLSSVT